LKNKIERTKTKAFWQHLVTLIILGLAVHLLLPQITTLENSWKILSKMLFWAVGLAFIAQTISYIGSGFLLQNTLELVNQPVPLYRSTLVVLGAASVALVAGGTVGSSAAIFKWTSNEKGSVVGATLASLFPSLFTSLMLVVFSFFGVIHLFLVHDLTKTQIIGFSITLAFLSAVIILSFLASHYRERASSVIQWFGQTFAKLRHQPFNPDLIQNEVDIIFFAWDELWKGKWLHLFLGAFINVSFDMLTLYCVFFATGDHISLGVLLSGYALPLILGRLAFFLPGGVGVIESSMAALYTGLGIPNATAVVVILGYRLISFWIPSILGFPIAAYLQNSNNR